MNGAADRVTFAHVETTFLVPRGHPAPHELRRRGESALRDHLHGALLDALTRMLPHQSPEVWIVRELHIDFPFAAERDDASLFAATWAREITQSLTRTIRDGDGVTRFPTRAAYLAQYAYDVACGRDRDSWYYAQFTSLGALPASAAIREAIVREPDFAADVLFELARLGKLEQILRAISDRSARAIYDTAFPEGEANTPSSPHMVEVILALAEELTSRGDDGSIATPHNAIRLLIRIRDQIGQSALSDLRVHVDRVLDFAALLARVGDPWRLVEAMLDGDTHAPLALAATGGGIVDVTTLQWFATLGNKRPDVLTCAASTLMPPATRDVDPTMKPSAFPGLALFLPSLIDLGLFDGDSDDDAALRAAVAVKCAAGTLLHREPFSPAVSCGGEGADRRMRGRFTRTSFAHVSRSHKSGMRPPHPPSAPSPPARNRRGRRTLGERTRQRVQADREKCGLVLGDPIIDLFRGVRGASTELSTDLEALAASAAEEVMANFAARLFGFAGSSFVYLYENFCAGAGLIRADGDRIVVDLPPVPLEVVLRMAGFHEREVAPPWLDGRIVVLRLGGAG